MNTTLFIFAIEKDYDDDYCSNELTLFCAANTIEEMKKAIADTFPKYNEINGTYNRSYTKGSYDDFYYTATGDNAINDVYGFEGLIQDVVNQLNSNGDYAEAAELLKWRDEEKAIFEQNKIEHQKRREAQEAESAARHAIEEKAWFLHKKQEYGETLNDEEAAFLAAHPVD